MIKRKRGLIFLLIAIMMITMLTACSKPKTAREALSEAILNEEEINTSQFKMALSLNVNTSNIYDPELAMYANMLNNAKLIIEGKTDLNEEKTAAELKLDLGGMSFSASLYQYDNTIAIHMPFLAQLFGDPSFADKYIVMDLDALMEEFAPEQQDLKDFDEEELMALYRKIAASSIDALSESALVDKGEQSVTAGTENVKAREIEIIINEEELINIVKNLITMLKDEEFRNQIFKILSSVDPYSSEEDFKRDLEEILEASDEDIDALFDEIRQNVNFENFKIQNNVFIDNKSNVVKAITEATISFKEDDQSIGLAVKAEADTWDINKQIAIEIPDIHAENSIDFYELLFMTMFAPFY
ncbi:hypothetical protein SAMN05446037_1003130 [Anaerovirgula multivorans]|uniref:Lipoprotein n=1 Tax=Anaerovirgula multivorans TaxID=312168 RepID=A0A239BA74_9FIRM|nr:hypothetical protein [Anaerovirgula multivorans]SNS04867.1 hypothetical protein SAMN05446037_1003130 [Anaerovirgula multivorans]